MSRLIKDMVISEIQERIGDHRDLLVVDCSKMDAVAANEWRLSLHKSNISVLSVKNSIARNALKRVGVDGLDSILAGPSSLVWGGDDVVALSKEMTSWAKKLDGLSVKGATVEGQSLDSDGVVALSKSPGRLELVGQIAGCLLGPGAQLAGVLQGPGGSLAGCLEKISGDEE